MTAEENNSEQQNKNWGGGGADQNTQGSQLMYLKLIKDVKNKEQLIDILRRINEKQDNIKC